MKPNPITTTALTATGRLPEIFPGRESSQTQLEVSAFYENIASVFDAWIGRRNSPHTQRTYRNHVLQFTRFLGLSDDDERTLSPGAAQELCRVTVQDVQRYRDYLVELDASPKTINGRLSALSSFYLFMREVAAEYRLPLNLPNPAHREWVPRAQDTAKKPTKALSLTQVRELLVLPQNSGGMTVLDYRDRAILSFLVAMGPRISTLCWALVEDFEEDEEQGPQMTLRLKGGSKVTDGIHPIGAQAIREYLSVAEISSGPLFRARLNPKSKKLGRKAISPPTMYRIVMGYLERLPRSMKTVELEDGTTKRVCRYHPHCARAAAATILLDAGVPITKVQKLLGHKNIETTRQYYKGDPGAREGASHAMPL